MTLQEITNWHLEEVMELWRDENTIERIFQLQAAMEVSRIERGLKNN